MYIGLLTARFGNDRDLDGIARWASQAGYKGLEIHTRHINCKNVIANDGAEVKALLEETGLKISSIAHYAGVLRNVTAEDYKSTMMDVIQAADVLGVDVVCTLAGFPVEGKSKVNTIRECLPEIFNPLAEEAGKRGIKIAFENWFATNLQNLECFKAITEALPQQNVGFNFDPSHLYWQQLDHIAAVDEFKDRIFHVHAKDTAIRKDVLGRVGVLEGSWWRYVIPGFGEIDWGRFILALREIGYDGVLSVEHEDRAFSHEEGFEKALTHLSQFV